MVDRSLTFDLFKMYFSTFAAFTFNNSLESILNASPYPLRFNSSVGKFEPIQSARDLISPYNIIVAIVFFLVLPVFFIYIFVYKAILHPSDVAFSRLFIQLVIFVPAFAVVFLYVVIISCREEISTYFNYVIQMKVNDTPIIQKSMVAPGNSWKTFQIILKSTFEEFSFLGRQRTGNVDKLAVGLILSSFATVLYMPLYPISILLVPYDYTSLILYDIFPHADQRLITKQAISCTAVSIAFIVVEQLLRFLRLVIISIVPVIQTFLVKLRRASEFELFQFEQALRMYKELCVINNVAHETSSRLAYVGYEFATMYGIVTLTGAVIGWKFMSTGAYLVLAVGNGIQIATLIHVLLPLGMSLDALSKKILGNWNKYCSQLPGSFRYNKRVLAALKPISFPIKHLGTIDQYFERRIFTRIVMNAQDLIVVLMTLA